MKQVEENVHSPADLYCSGVRCRQAGGYAERGNRGAAGYPLGTNVTRAESAIRALPVVDGSQNNVTQHDRHGWVVKGRIAADRRACRAVRASCWWTLRSVDLRPSVVP